jgi:hypothetical protein
MAFYDKYLKDDEELILILRSFPPVYTLRFLVAMFFLLLPFFLVIPLFQMQAFGVIIFFLLLSGGVIMVTRVVVLAYFNCFLVSNERIIDCDQRGLFDRLVSEAGFAKIEDISYRIKGAFGTLFNYGTLRVQTLGATVILELGAVRRPQQVQSVILDIKRNLVLDKKNELPAEKNS